MVAELEGALSKPNKGSGVMEVVMGYTPWILNGLDLCYDESYIHELVNSFN